MSSIMQPVHVSTQSHSSAAEREERAEQCRDRREKKKKPDELVNMRTVIAEWVFKHFQCIKQKSSVTSIAEHCLYNKLFMLHQMTQSSVVQLVFFFKLFYQIFGILGPESALGRRILAEISAPPHLLVLAHIIVGERQFVPA